VVDPLAPSPADLRPPAAPAGRATGGDPCARRPIVHGKFLLVDGEKFYVRGVTYGAFRPDSDGHEYHDVAVVERDFAQMVASGVTAVRIPHTTPPRSLLDVAQRHGLKVMVGMSAEQYLGFEIDRRRDVSIERLVRDRVRHCAGHPALLCYALGNEIPASIARWYGRNRVERYLERICRVIKDEDPEGLVTYVNYPSTEYLELPFLDLLCYNVYLESQQPLQNYIARLQNIAGDRPLILSEIGLDSLRNGEDQQARSLDWQIRAAFAGGCAGVFVFAWTDEWHRAGAEVDDWAFGITDRGRAPKPALGAVRRAFSEVPFPDLAPPRVSVVVCTYNGSRTLRDCLEGVARLQYPDFETIVVDDGSTDRTAEIAREYDVRLIRTPNRGLSNARNIGLAAATGTIVAYLDDDAWPDPHWLQYLAATFGTTDHAGVGGPNIPPPGAGPVAECIAHAPGGPVHVLLSDQVAEHIPGCNMAFRRDRLEAIGGFDPQFRVAGDDVDVCWRLQQRGWTLGFHPAAMVWHRPRSSVRDFWKQQCGYGNAEGVLQKKWPEKYNGTGQLSWAGRIYSRGSTSPLLSGRHRIYHGMWGSAPFQRLYQPDPSALHSLTLTPEWYLALPILAGLVGLGILWHPLFGVLPLLAIATLVPLAQAWISAGRVPFSGAPRSRARRFALRVMTALFHVLHPLARLWGRMRGRGFDPPLPVRSWPWPRALDRWVERGEAPVQRLERLERTLRNDGIPVRRGGGWDRWDLEVVGGAFGATRLIVIVEDHGAGNQLVRFRWWPNASRNAVALVLVLGALSLAAVIDGAGPAAAILGAAAGALAVRVGRQCGLATAIMGRVVRGSA
jgi:GT2 family glycosyltransferase